MGSGMAQAVLVGYDPRRADRAPVELGASVARFTGAPLIVAIVQAVGPTVRGAGAEVDPDLLPDCSAALGQLGPELRADGIAADCRVVLGTSAARALHVAAADEDAGLLVVGSSHRSGPGRVLAGTTALRLLHGSPCPVAVTPHGWTPSGDGRPATIGVGYVDSDEGREALRGAHALARRAGATLRVVVVVQDTVEIVLETEPSYVAGQFGRDREDVEGEHKWQAEQAARQALAELAGDVPVEVEGVVGVPAEVLVDLSRRLDLLVCGSRGYGPLRAVLLGSVSAHVVAEAHCPVVVVPRGVRASLEALVAETPGATAPA
jgi:nucleotide-binding universal stress UspA family protein